MTLINGMILVRSNLASSFTYVSNGLHQMRTVSQEFFILVCMLELRLLMPSYSTA
jgi:hypothetical protein